MRCKRIVKTAVKTAGMGMIAACMLLGNLTGTMRVVHGEEYEYDALNRVVKVIYEDGSYVEYSYDSNGNIVKVTVHTDKPEQPSVPTDPEEPDIPDKPGNPDNPEEPDIPVKPWRPVRDDGDDEGDEPEEMKETGDRPFDFTDPFAVAGSSANAAIVGNAGNAGIQKKAVVPQTDAKADQPTERAQAGTFTPPALEESSQNEADLQSTTVDGANTSGEGTEVLFQILVILFQVFFVPVLKWLTQTL